MNVPMPFQCRYCLIRKHNLLSQCRAHRRSVHGRFDAAVMQHLIEMSTKILRNCHIRRETLQPKHLHSLFVSFSAINIFTLMP